MKHTDFSFSYEQEPHKERTKKILSDHPEIRQYIGRNPYTFFAILGIVGLQIALAYFLREQSWWVVLLVAYFVGAFANHSLFVMIHECAHNLIFKKKSSNLWAGMIANLPIVTPSSVGFQKYHLKHHAFQGVYELDADIPSKWEARLVGHSAVGKALWLLLYPFTQATRPFRLKEINPFSKWSITNAVVQLSFDAAIFFFWGPQAFFYFVFSLFFSIGLHPLGARWIQRHYLMGSTQETYSYYGALNTVAFNVGYHNEHHDFPSVSWNNLPKVKQTAPEAYDPLISHKSWTRLLFKFLFSREISLFSRIVRKDRGEVEFDADVIPDVEFIEKNKTNGKKDKLKEEVAVS